MKKGNTIIIVTHEEELLSMHTGVIKIRDGLIESDTLSDKGHKPRQKKKF
ncbi:MAG: hypothetical protein R2942_04015 [Ignavibacteria bacterium]